MIIFCRRCRRRIVRYPTLFVRRDGNRYIARRLYTIHAHRDEWISHCLLCIGIRHRRRLGRHDRGRKTQSTHSRRWFAIGVAIKSVAQPLQVWHFQFPIHIASRVALDNNPYPTFRATSAEFYHSIHNQQSCAIRPNMGIAMSILPDGKFRILLLAKTN